MAEAAVEERPSHWFYCHLCNLQFQTSSVNYICPQCSDGFVEKLEGSVGADRLFELGGSDSSSSRMATDDGDDSDEDNMQMLSEVQTAFAGAGPRSGAWNRSGRRRGHRPRPRHLTRPPRMLVGGGGARLAVNNLLHAQPFDHLIQEFIVNLGVMGGNGNMQLFLGNPGDYVWGREGLDAIVTQLLNQMDTTGPPPLAKDDINAIPLVSVTSDQVEKKLQCSVCWEDFKLEEKVRQLACQHIYHDQCIRPWLSLHSTCPICRQDLRSEEETSQDAANEASPAYPMNTLQQLFQAVQNSGLGGSSSAADTENTPSSTSSSNNTDRSN